MHKSIQGDDSLNAALDREMLGDAYMLAGDDEAALRNLDTALDVMRRTHVPQTLMRSAFESEATILFKRNAPGFREKARALLEQIAQEQLADGDLVGYGSTVQKLGLECLTMGDRECTIRALQASVMNETSLHSPTFLSIGAAHVLLGSGWYGFGEYDNAVDEFAIGLEGTIEKEGSVDEVQHADTDVPLYLDALWQASRPPRTSGRTTAATAFMAAQLDQQTRAAKALSQMVARTAATNGPLADLVRRDEDLENQRVALEKGFAEALSHSGSGDSRPAKADSIRARIAAVGEEQRKARAELRRSFPEYGALTAPPIAPPEKLQELLREGELLLSFDFGPRRGFVWALSREGLAWTKIDLTDAQLESEVRALRSGLDHDDGSARGVVLAKSHSPSPTFDRDRSYRLYQALFGRLGDPIARARHLLVVPSGALQSLPLGVLVTRDPGGAAHTFNSYRDTSWLIREKSITVLPSVSGLASMRGTSEGPPASKAFIGFGAPTLSAAEVNRGLQALPDSEAELRRIAAALGATDGDVHVADRATEDALDAMDLSDYRVVAFATHGLMAHEIEPLAEPALVFSAPFPGDHGDGFLTASEVAGLRLHAEWVVLSACNSAAGDGSPREQVFSGLARAFFYAGARGVLVSHWSVNSQAASELTTKTFEQLRRDPALGRAEALRRATLAVMNEPFHSDPAFWGPFSFIGGGGEGRGR